jgi:hypothetical protein
MPNIKIKAFFKFIKVKFIKQSLRIQSKTVMVFTPIMKEL